MSGLSVNSGVGGAVSGSMGGLCQDIPARRCPSCSPCPSCIHSGCALCLGVSHASFSILLYNPAFRQFLASIPALPLILPLSETLPCWTSVPTSEADEEASSLHSYMPAPACNQHFPSCWNPLSFPVVYDLPLFPVSDAGVQAWNPQLLSCFLAQNRTAHSRVRSGPGRAQ